MSSRRTPRIAFLLLPGLDHFAQDVLARLPEASGWEVRGWSIRTPADYASALAWAANPGDVLWFEFCWPPFPQFIANTDFGGRRVVVRVHRIEAAETGHVAATPWGKVHDVIVVSAEMAARVRGAVGSARLHLVHNGVDLDRFKPLTSWQPFRLGWCGTLIMRKNPVLALQILAALRRMDSRYHLTISSSGGEPLAMECFAHFVRRMGLQDAVSSSGRVLQQDMPAWHAQNGVLLHTSLHEGLSYAVLEAAAVGCDVAMLDHPGADACWPAQMRYLTPDEAVRIISEAAPHRWRRFVQAQYSLEAQIARIAEILGHHQ